MFGFEEQPAKQGSESGAKTAAPAPAAHSLNELMKQSTPGAPPSGAKPGGPGVGAGTSPEKLDMQALSEAASQLFRAMDGLGTDEKTIHTILAGKTKAEIEAIKRIYADHFQTRDSQGNYKPRDLEADLRNELSGKDLNEVEAALSGDQIKRAAVTLQNALDSWFPDKELVHATLGQINQLTEVDSKTGKAQNPKAREQLAAEFQRLTGKSLEAVLKVKLSGILSDTEFKIAQREMKGDLAGANAVKLDEAMHGGFLGIGTDEDKIHEVLGSVKSKDERRKLLAAYQKETQEEDEEGRKIAGTGKDLTADLASELSGAEEDIANTMLSDDRFDKDPAKRRAAEARIAAGRIRLAAEGLGTDETAIFKQFEDAKDPLLRDEIKRQYNAQYGDEEHGGVDFDQMLTSELSGNDLERTKQLVDSGEMDPAFALKYAMDGAGTDEELIINTLKKCKTWNELQNVRKAYMRLKKSEDLFILDKDLENELSGREGEEVLHQLLQGSNTQDLSPRRKIELAKRAYNFERGSGAGVFGNFVTDLFADSGQILDLQNQRILAIEKEYEQKGKNPELMQRLDATLSYQKQDVENYQAIQDAITNTGALVGTAVVGTILTVATWGVAGPAMASVIGALAGGAAGIAVKAGMKGDSYSTEDLAMDLAMTLVSAATVGAAAGPFAQIAMRVASLAKSAPMLEFMVMEALKGGQMGITSGIAAGLLDENTWRGAGNGVANFFHHVGVSTLGATASALGTAGMGKLMGQGSRTWNATAGAAGGVIGSAAQAAVESGGDLDAFATSFENNAAGNVLQGVVMANMAHPPQAKNPTSSRDRQKLKVTPELRKAWAEYDAHMQRAALESAPPPAHVEPGVEAAPRPVEAAPKPQEAAAPPQQVRQPKNFYEGAQIQWEAPTSEAAYQELHPRWQELEANAARLRNGQQPTPETLDEINKQRMSASGTARGEHGGVVGASQAETKSQAQANWHQADEFVHTLAQSGEKLSIEKICQINELLGKNLANNDGTPGQVRTQEVNAGGFRKSYIESKAVPGALNDFVSWYHQAEQQGMHPVELAARAYQQLVSIHPFTDANGRTCRMVMDWILQKHGLPPATLVDHEVNVAVFGLAGIAGDTGITPEQAIKFVTQGVERTMKMMDSKASNVKTDTQAQPESRTPAEPPQSAHAKKNQAVELDLNAIAAAAAEYDAANAKKQAPHSADGDAVSQPQRKLDEELRQAAKPISKEMDAKQKEVQRAELRYAGRQGGGNSGHEMYNFTHTLPDGTVEEYIFRPMDHKEKSAVRFRKEAAAYKLNAALGFDNGFPLTVERTLDIEGEPRRGWLQRKAGQTIDTKFGGGPLRQMAGERFGGPGTSDDVIRMLKEDPHMHNQAEQMLLERLIYGDGDDHGLNAVMASGADGKARLQNIDLDFGFSDAEAPQFGTGSQQGLTSKIHQMFGDQPISPQNLQRIRDFVGQFEGSAGQHQLNELGLTSAESKAMLARAKWLLKEGKMPRHISLDEMMAQYENKMKGTK